MNTKAVKAIGVVSLDVPVTQEHASLRSIAARLALIHHDDPDITALADVLKAIGLGLDANIAFGVKRLRGHDPKKNAMTLNTNLAVAWTLSAMSSLSNGGLGMSKATAIGEAAKHFHLDEDNLARQIRRHKNKRQDGVFSMHGARPSNGQGQKKE